MAVEALAISCTDLTKVYPTGTVALDRLTLSIPRGTSFALVGENGAGKSTLVGLILGLLFPTQGILEVLGHRQVRLAHSRLGYLPERQNTERRLSARRYLSYLGELAGLWGVANRQRIAAVLEMVDLVAAADAPLGTYSKGMLQRVGLAQALLGEPDLLILDEPTSGLDPYSQWAVRRIIGQLRQQGVTLLICSHYLVEVEELCDTVAILQRGRCLRAGTIQNLLDEVDGRSAQVAITLAGPEPAIVTMERLGLANRVTSHDALTLHLPAAQQATVLSALVQAAVAIRSLHPLHNTLEDVYLRATRAAPADQVMSAPGHPGGSADRSPVGSRQ